MVVDTRKRPPSLHVLWQVQAALHFSEIRAKPLREQRKARWLLMVVASATVCTFFVNAHACVHAGREVWWLVYIPLVRTPIDAMGGATLTLWCAVRYARTLEYRIPQLPRMLLDTLADQRLPLWRATLALENERNALMNLCDAASLPRRGMAFFLLEAATQHVLLSYQLIKDLAPLGKVGHVNLAGRHRKMAEEMQRTLEADVRMIRAFRASPVE